LPGKTGSTKRFLTVGATELSKETEQPVQLAPANHTAGISTTLFDTAIPPRFLKVLNQEIIPFSLPPLLTTKITVAFGTAWMLNILLAKF